MSEVQRNLLRQYDVETAPAGYQLLDAFSHVGGHDSCCVVLPSSSHVIEYPVLGEADGPVVYPHGTGFVTGNNPLLVDVLRAPETAYVGDKEGNAVETRPGHLVKFAGSRMSLVAALQTRANSRIGFVGSSLMLSDKWWGKKLDG